jgi:hypothetical protein
VSEKLSDAQRRARMAETVRLVVSRREQAPRSPRMEQALKRLIWRYHRELQLSHGHGPSICEASESRNDGDSEEAQKEEDD